MEYLLPDLGEGMADAEVVQWRVTVGEHVTRDQIVVHVQTDKAEVELPVPASGTITSLGAAVGDVVPVGAALLVLVPDAGTELAGTPVRAPAAAGRAPVTPRSPAPAPGAPVHAPPPVRKLARELGVDLHQVAGTGPSGRITAADVRAAGPDTSGADTSSPDTSSPNTSGDAAANANTRRVPLRGIRRSMARNMAAAWREVPHITMFDEIDARPLLDAQASVRGRAGADRLTLTAFLVRAVVLAVPDAPVVNASLDSDAEEIVMHDACHVGIAVATDDGLVVPVVHDAQARSLIDLGLEIGRLTEAARSGRLDPATLRGATFTVTNFGTEGGRFATPIIRPPQSAIFGFGAIRVQPVVDGTQVVAAPALPMSLSADHRIVDGRDAIRFFEAVRTLLADPTHLADST
jgi:pyruvate/2-oxoglutarate dehydrogenase complex dihydrolipoamide acyltransferase (E2) component